MNRMFIDAPDWTENLKILIASLTVDMCDYLQDQAQRNIKSVFWGKWSGTLFLTVDSGSHKCFKVLVGNVEST